MQILSIHESKEKKTNSNSWYYNYPFGQKWMEQNDLNLAKYISTLRNICNNLKWSIRFFLCFLKFLPFWFPAASCRIFSFMWSCNVNSRRHQLEDIFHITTINILSFRYRCRIFSTKWKEPDFSFANYSEWLTLIWNFTAQSLIFVICLVFYCLTRMHFGQLRWITWPAKHKSLFCNLSSTFQKDSVLLTEFYFTTNSGMR